VKSTVAAAMSASPSGGLSAKEGRAVDIDRGGRCRTLAYLARGVWLCLVQPLRFGVLTLHAEFYIRFQNHCFAQMHRYYHDWPRPDPDLGQMTLPYPIRRSDTSKTPSRAPNPSRLPHVLCPSPTVTTGPSKSLTALN
jgi:hypothetical protein